MDREIVFAVLAVILVGVSLPVGSLLAAAFDGQGDLRRPGKDVERHATRRLFLPLVPVTFAIALLLGWASAEPDDSERIPWTSFVIAWPVLLVWGRTLVRACRALAPRRVRTAATVGIVVPRVVLDRHFAQQIDASACQAALAHERAHAMHRDPLRIWLAQIVTDLQWPLPGAKLRFDRWLGALELARDEEARAEVDGADLAAAVIAAARIEKPAPFAYAGITSADAVLRLRIGRLLAPVLASSPRESPRATMVLFLLAAAGFSFLGAGFGEALVRQVLGWDR